MSVQRTLLSAGLLDLAGLANADQSVVGLELLHGLGGVVDEGEASGLATTELCAETKDIDLLLVGLVHASELLAEVILGDVGTTGVEDVTVNATKHWSVNRVSDFGIAPTIPSPNLDPISNLRPKLGSDFVHQIEAISRPTLRYLRHFDGLNLMGQSSRRRVVEDGIGRIGVGDKSVGIALSAIEAPRGVTHTTICLRPSRGLRMNLRVRRVTGASESAMVAVLRDFGDQDREVCWWLDFALKRCVFCWTPNCASGGSQKNPIPWSLKMGAKP